MNSSAKSDRELNQWLRSPRLWIGLVIFAIAVAFIIQNRDPVEINLLTFTISSPQWVTFTVLFLAGLATGHLTSRRKRD